jgi:hypothetical protein
MDYLELYDRGEALLLIGWVDKFGIRRTVIDLGLFQADASSYTRELLYKLSQQPGGTMDQIKRSLLRLTYQNFPRWGFATPSI